MKINIIKRAFKKQVKKGFLLRAILIKNAFSLFFLLFSVTWLLFWGIELIFTNFSYPYIKVTAIVIGYGIPITNIYVGYMKLKWSYDLYQYKKSLRSGDT